jgi:hypothetical protein
MVVRRRCRLLRRTPDVHLSSKPVLWTRLSRIAFRHSLCRRRTEFDRHRFTTDNGTENLTWHRPSAEGQRLQRQPTRFFEDPLLDP